MLTENRTDNGIPDQLQKNHREIPEQVNQLIEYVKSEIIQGDSKSASKLIGHWFPLYFYDTEPVITNLYHTFSAVHERLRRPQRTLRFLDCGSGYGIISAIASQAGFDASGIELLPDVHDKAVHHRKRLADAGLIDINNVHLYQGSYYVPEYFDRAVNRYQQNIRRKFSSIETNLSMFNFEFSTDVKTHEELDAKLIELRQSTTALRESGLVTPDNRLDFDVVFCNPSDPLFPYGFFEQMDILLPYKSQMVIRSVNSQVAQARDNGSMQIFGHVDYPELRSGSMQFEVLEVG
jgi:hypothetical protein